MLDWFLTLLGLGAPAQARIHPDRMRRNTLGADKKEAQEWDALYFRR